MSEPKKPFEPNVRQRDVLKAAQEHGSLIRLPNGYWCKDDKGEMQYLAIDVAVLVRNNLLRYTQQSEGPVKFATACQPV